MDLRRIGVDVGGRTGRRLFVESEDHIKQRHDARSHYNDDDNSALYNHNNGAYYDDNSALYNHNNGAYYDIDDGAQDNHNNGAYYDIDDGAQDNHNNGAQDNHYAAALLSGRLYEQPQPSLPLEDG